MNWAQFKDPLCHVRLAGTMIVSWSTTKEVVGSSPFTIMRNIFVAELCENIWGKLNRIEFMEILSSRS